MPTLSELATYMDELLQPADFADWANALNGIQFEHRGPITRIAAAVDLSRGTIEGAAAQGANLLLVHHGMFWGGLQQIRGPLYARIRLLIEHDIAVYASHLPLDAHPEIGNNVLLARELALTPDGGFAHIKGKAIGLHGRCNLPTTTLVQRARAFSGAHGGDTRVVGAPADRVTRRWGMCTGAGVDAEFLKEAADLGVDTLIVGEGPHWSAVEAPELGIAVLYLGHYATETLGVRALASRVGTAFSIPWSFIDAPTGL